MVGFKFIITALYIGMLIYIIPSKGYFFDLYERKFRLLPYWMKLLGFCWIILSVVLIVMFKDKLESWEELLLSNLNLSLFIIFFSKEKHEDEYSGELRFKAFSYAFVAIVALIGSIAVLNIGESNSVWSNFILQGYVSGGLIVATLYFYSTLYKLRKGNG